VTGGARWVPMLERLAHSLGFAPRLASVRTTAITGGQASSDPAGAAAALAQACKEARAEDGAQEVILGGAGFAGLAERVASLAGFPIIDSVLAGARTAERLAFGAPVAYARRGAAKPTDAVGLGATLADKLLE
jgi:Asp/Glu/hydantoin racemase